MAEKKSKKFKVTKDGLEELKKELKERKTEIRKNLQDQLNADIEEGDISENTSYYRVQEEIGSNDKRIEELEELIKNAVVVEENGDSCGGKQKIDIGCTVEAKVKGKKMKFNLVGATEADPSENKISIESPIGKALQGQIEGDKVDVKTPNGSVTYDIIKVS